MKICWDNLNEYDFYLTEKGNFRSRIYKRTYYINICKRCGEEYIGFKNSVYCSNNCAKSKENHPLYGKKLSKGHRNKISNSNYGRKLSEETKRKISKSHVGKKHTKETKEKLRKLYEGRKYEEIYGEEKSLEIKQKISKKGKENNFWKGGYGDVPLYDTYAHQIDWVDKCKRNKEDSNVLEVKCAYCGKWFIPTKTSVYNRIASLKGIYKGENRFYCSEGCKKECPIYGKMPITLMREDAIRSGRMNWIELNREVQPELRQMVFDRDNYTCQKCGETEHLHCHHIKPVVDDPIESADIDNCITLCKECHKEAHQKDGCRYNELRICV